MVFRIIIVILLVFIIGQLTQFEEKVLRKIYFDEPIKEEVYKNA